MAGPDASPSSHRPAAGAAIRDLNPGYFALVMATGIVSRAVRADGSARLSGILLALTIACYAVLVVAYGWRLAGYRREFLADLANPRKTFAFFTFVAASDVLGSRLAADGHSGATVGLLIVASLAWLVLNYGVPLMLIARHGTQSALAGANGTWFIWVVGTQSLAVSATVLPPPVAAWVVALSVTCWSVGVVLYVVVAALVVTSLLQYPVGPADVTPAYWVFMGATAISVLAGAQILLLPADPLLTATRPVIAGMCVILWAFGTWLIPFLLGAGVWRHLIRKVRLTYEPGLWSIVFPVGMYGVASRELGKAVGVSWLATLGSDEAWLALAVWAVVFVAMLGSLLFQFRQPRSSPAAVPAPAGEGRERGPE
ncbi:MAG TPA: tellurite resistance/C4-dicarboxylate transporter family protein [Streptosporangiaceae bacterium]|nr:tellurite resistance/C4-dicarboxylate transporter family protein [Streptosporangiaceae bacterium]